ARRLVARGPCPQQVAGLAGIARPELDHRAGTDLRTERCRMPCQQRVLRAGQIVFGLPRDRLEEGAALGIVEIATREPARIVAQTAYDRLRERRPRQRAVGEVVVAHWHLARWLTLLPPGESPRRRRAGNGWCDAGRWCVRIRRRRRATAARCVRAHVESSAP